MQDLCKLFNTLVCVHLVSTPKARFVFPIPFCSFVCCYMTTPVSPQQARFQIAIEFKAQQIVYV